MRECGTRRDVRQSCCCNPNSYMTYCSTTSPGCAKIFAACRWISSKILFSCRLLDRRKAPRLRSIDIDGTSIIGVVMTTAIFELSRRQSRMVVCVVYFSSYTLNPLSRQRWLFYSQASIGRRRSELIYPTSS